MGKKPIRRSPKEVTLAAQSESVTDVLPYSFESPESSAIIGASYDPDTQALTVVLRHGGGTPYLYQGFPAVMWKEFLESTSKGTYFQQRIRPVFMGTKGATR